MRRRYTQGYTHPRLASESSKSPTMRTPYIVVAVLALLAAQASAQCPADATQFCNGCAQCTFTCSCTALANTAACPGYVSGSGFIPYNGVCNSVDDGCGGTADCGALCRAGSTCTGGVCVPDEIGPYLACVVGVNEAPCGTGTVCENGTYDT